MAVRNNTCEMPLQSDVKSSSETLDFDHGHISNYDDFCLSCSRDGLHQKIFKKTSWIEKNVSSLSHPSSGICIPLYMVMCNS